MTVKDARIKMRFSQREVCELIGIPRRTLESWESGQRKPPDYVERLVVEKIINIGRKEEKMMSEKEIQKTVSR